jgi:RsiW-degrading membrane proteinase PrsW (M82 family)
VSSDAKYCATCGHALHTDDAAAALFNRQAASKFQSMADKITDQLGLERLEGFSIRQLFSEVFRRRQSDQFEQYLGVGMKSTTPSLIPEMGQWPRPWLFVRTLFFSLAVFGILFSADKSFRNINMTPALIMFGSLATPLTAVILFFELNTPRNVSIVRVIQLAILGGAISIPIFLLLFEVAQLSEWYGKPVAGLMEEPVKLGALLLLARFSRQNRYRFHLNGLLFGACVGAGFAVFDSAWHALLSAHSGTNSETLIDIIVHGILAPFGHIAWTAIAACALWRVQANGAPLMRSLFHSGFLKLFAVSVGLNFIWKLPVHGPFLLKYFLIGFIAYVVIFSLVQTGLKEIRLIAQKQI